MLVAFFQRVMYIIVAGGGVVYGESGWSFSTLWSCVKFLARQHSDSVFSGGGAGGFWQIIFLFRRRERDVVAATAVPKRFGRGRIKLCRVENYTD